ncbi:hypothetical protein LMG29542_08750 [Paraburkholderia humisilvae]|uniref:Uncharacterized protein n=1 Tax=Paraburkholderia humisilvae TaxID=627669 RepID=A0A6J5F8Z3_9BURK|nr:hypothetical protein LMG29542_08750 [Paraburkholderia humisilvae]
MFYGKLNNKACFCWFIQGLIRMASGALGIHDSTVQAGEPSGHSQATAGRDRAGTGAFPWGSAKPGQSTGYSGGRAGQPAMGDLVGGASDGSIWDAQAVGETAPGCDGPACSFNVPLRSAYI